MAPLIATEGRVKADAMSAGRARADVKAAKVDFADHEAGAIRAHPVVAHPAKAMDDPRGAIGHEPVV